ncbi:MAG TPA: glycine/sarcosine/betaine reductase selenoprotein B family protein [Candidatus Binataceae bacterium]
MAEPPVEYIRSITRQYAKLGYKPYGWVYNTDPPPWQPLRKPLSRCRVGLVASGGIYRRGQTAFHSKDDTSLRLIPTDVRTEELRTSHFAYDQTDARRDPNVVFPIDTLRGLVKEGFIGGLTSHAIAFMGGIYSTRRVREETMPAITRILADEHADLALLVPV